MEIQAQTNYKPINQPTFSSNKRSVTNKFGKMMYRNTSCFFRDDLQWDKFADVLIERYKDVPKVNIYNFACSEGAEPFSLAMILIKKLGEKKAQKFFPIIASDIDDEILKNPMKGEIKLSNRDLLGILDNIGAMYKKFITYDNKFKYNLDYDTTLCSGKVKPLLQDSVVFKKANVFDEIQNIEKDNSVVLCRNFWPYLGYFKDCKLAEMLSQNLNQSSMCVIGDFDTDEAKPILQLKNFKDYHESYTGNDTYGIKNTIFVRDTSKKNEFLSKLKLFINFLVLR